MGNVPYPTFAKKLKAALKGKDHASVAEASNIPVEKLKEAEAGHHLPSIEEIYRLAKSLGKRSNVFIDATLDDIAAANNDLPQAEPRKAVSTSPAFPKNRW